MRRTLKSASSTSRSANSTSRSDFIFQKGVQILFEDANGLLALEKPAGILSHPNNGNSGKVQLKKNGLFLNTSYDTESESYYIPGSSSNGATERFWLINRLDSATSGVILVAKTKEVSNAVKIVFKERSVTKTYFALVFGHLKNKNNVTLWEDDVDVRKGKAHVRMESGGSNKLQGNRKSRLSTPTAKTNMKGVLYDAASDTYLLELTPLTGYTHQLRYQCSIHGHPIVGDKVYGDFSRNKLFKGTDLQSSSSDNSNPDEQDSASSIDRPRQPTPRRSRLYLHSHHIHLQYTYSNQLFTFSATSPLPAGFTMSSSTNKKA
jgi:tRNA pseudouridine65 synthase